MIESLEPRTSLLYRSDAVKTKAIAANVNPVIQQDCLFCVRSGNCELQSLTQEYGVRTIRYTGERVRRKVGKTVA